MVTFLTIFHAIVCILLIIFVLIQFGKGAEAGLVSGGAADGMNLGPSKGNFISKFTALLAVLFLVNSLVLAKLHSSKTEKSLLDSETTVAKPLNSDAQPVAPAQPAVPVENKAQAPVENAK